MRAYASKIKKVSRKLIQEHPNICGGAPVISGTRIPVATIIEFNRLGLPVSKILNQYPHLTKQQIFAALEYYQDHKDKIDKLIKEEHDSER